MCFKNEHKIYDQLLTQMHVNIIMYHYVLLPKKDLPTTYIIVNESFVFTLFTTVLSNCMYQYTVQCTLTASVLRSCSIQTILDT